MECSSLCLTILGRVHFFDILFFLFLFLTTCHIGLISEPLIHIKKTHTSTLSNFKLFLSCKMFYGVFFNCGPVKCPVFFQTFFQVCWEHCYMFHRLSIALQKVNAARIYNPGVKFSKTSDRLKSDLGIIFCRNS